METNTWLALAIAAILQLLILYYVIKSAVRSAVKEANNDLYTQMKLMNQLKIAELRKQGIADNELEKVIDLAFEDSVTQQLS